jgi:hypothetical protein
MPDENGATAPKVKPFFGHNGACRPRVSVAKAAKAFDLPPVTNETLGGFRYGPEEAERLRRPATWRTCSLHDLEPGVDRQAGRLEIVGVAAGFGRPKGRPAMKSVSSVPGMCFRRRSG